MWAVSWAARVKVTTSSTPNRLNYFVIFSVLVTCNVSAGCETQPGGQWVSQTLVKVFMRSVRYFLSNLT